MKTHLKRFIQLTFLVILLSLGIVVAQAKDNRPYLRVINASLSVRSVDVYVENTLYFQDVDYSYISNYVPVDQGERSLQVRPAGIKDGADLITGGRNFELDEGNISKYYTAVILEKEVWVFEDDNMRALSPGQTRVRMINASQGPAVEICLNDECETLTYKRLTHQLEDCQQDMERCYITLDAGAHDLNMRLIGTDELYVDVLPVAFESGEVYSIFILDPEQGEIRPRIIPYADIGQRPSYPPGVPGQPPYFPGTPGQPPLYPPVTGAFLSPTALLILVVAIVFILGGSFWIARRYLIHRAGNRRGT